MENLNLTKNSSTYILAVSKLSIIELYGKLDLFVEEEAIRLKDWISTYYQNNQEPLKLVYKPSIFPMPPNYFPLINDNFDAYFWKGGSYTYPHLAIQTALDTLKMYSFHIFGDDSRPHIIGHWQSGLVKLFGDFYTSCAKEVTAPLHAWLKLYFKNANRNVRLEFWMGYVNTIGQRIFAEILKILEIYQQSSQNSIKVYWYYLDDDIDMIEMGNLLKKTTILDFEIISVNENIWKNMNKDCEKI